MRQGIISIDGYTENSMKLRINAADKLAGNAKDKAIADAYGNKFIIPLDFKMLERVMPYYQEDSETDYVTKLGPAITTELLIPQ